MNPVPFFSVVTCCRNARDFLGDCLASVEAQRFRDFQHVIVDGRSDDGSGAILARYARGKGHVSLHAREPKGIADAMNEGIRCATGRYVIHLHADDLFYGPDVLSRAAELLRETDPDWGYGRAESIDGEGRHLGWYLSNRRLFQVGSAHPLSRTWVKWVDFIPHQAVFVKRDTFLEHGLFDETLGSGMDPDLWNRLAGRTRWHFLDLAVCKRRVHGAARSTGVHHREANARDFEAVKRRYLNPVEFFIAKLAYRLHHFNR